HVGKVFYGNVGSRERLDFTVLGPAVNEASRIAAMCRSVDQPVLMSARSPMSATLNAGSFRSDDTLYAASPTLQSYLRSILMQKWDPTDPKVRLGHKQTKRYYGAMSTLPPKADIERHDRHVRLVPKADIARIITCGAVTIVKRRDRTRPLPRVGRTRRAIPPPALDHPQHRAPRQRPSLPAPKDRIPLSNAVPKSPRDTLASHLRSCRT